MPMPNFLVIGAAKAGTTSIYYYLKQHPQVYMSPVKEPRFFAFGMDGTRDFYGPKDEGYITSTIFSLEDYKALFDKVSDEIAIGEASPPYLYHPEAAERIWQYLPDAKIIAILRDPSERAFSSYCYALQGGREPLEDFAQALQEEPIRRQKRWSARWIYSEWGFYFAQLTRYFNRFNQEQIRIYLYEDLCNDPIGVMQDMYGFIGVDKSFIPNVKTKYNVTNVFKNSLIYRITIKREYIKFIRPFLPSGVRKTLKSHLISSRPPLSPSVRKQLINLYRDDILKLQDLINRDLSAWLSVNQ
jgi:hypothetical protein